MSYRETSGAASVAFLSLGGVVFDLVVRVISEDLDQFLQNLIVGRFGSDFSLLSFLFGELGLGESGEQVLLATELLTEEDLEIRGLIVRISVVSSIAEGRVDVFRSVLGWGWGD